MFSNLLCAVDFSEPSTHGLRVAAALAHELRAPLSLLHAWHLPALAYTGMSGAPLPTDRWLADASGRLGEAADDAKHHGAGEVTTRVALGEAAHEIAKAAAAGGHDLVVIGSHGRSGVARFLLGSVAERVVREASCSVLVDRVPRDLSALALPVGGHVFRHALCAVDFSAATDTVVQRALDLLPGPGARLALVHAIEPLAVYDWFGKSSGLSAAFEQETRDRLDAIANRVRAERDLDVTTHVLHGHPAGAIVDAIDADASIDVAVVATHGVRGMRRLLVGSVAEKIVRHAAVPVLVSR